MKPLVVRDAIVGGVPSLPLPRAHRDSTCAPMREKLGALIGVSRGGRVAHGHFQAELRVAVGGCEVERAEDFCFLVEFCGVDMDADVGLEVRGPCGPRPTSSPLAPWLRWHHGRRHGGTASWGSPSSLAMCWRCAMDAWSSGTGSMSSRATMGSRGVPFVAVASRTFATTSGKGHVRSSRLAPLCNGSPSACRSAALRGNAWQS
jgi:hypothetical protein